MVNGLIIIQGNHNDVIRTCWERDTQDGEALSERHHSPGCFPSQQLAPSPGPFDMSVSRYKEGSCHVACDLEFKAKGVLFTLVDSVIEMK